MAEDQEYKFQEYPKTMHGPDGASVAVKSKEEQESLGEGWVDGHAFWSGKAEDQAKSAVKTRK
jgi:hypothetical protein